MGLIARRTIVHLDTNIVSGLVSDETARNAVREARRNGGDIYLCPAVVREFCTAPTNTRSLPIEAAIEYCDGFSNVPGYDMLLLEIKCLAEGKAVPPIPTHKIERLREILDDTVAARMRNEPAKQRKAGHIGILDELVRGLKDRALNLEFEPFMREGIPPILKLLLDRAPNDAGVGALTMAAKQPKHTRGDKYGLMGLCATLTANIYRRSLGLGKGAGCFSDLMNLVEVSHSDVLLTRDQDLYECFKLVASAIEDARPRVIRVPDHS